LLNSTTRQALVTWPPDSNAEHKYQINMKT